MEVVSRTCFGGGFGVAVGVTVLEGFVVGVAAGGVEVGVLGVVSAVGVDVGVVVGVVVGVLSAAGFRSLPQATSSPIVATPAVPARRACFHPRVNMSSTFS
jgi:hypothetical protein